MQTQDTNISATQGSTPKYREPRGSRSGRVFGGMIVILVGVVFLARQMGVDFPYWLVSWPMIIIAVGVYIGVRHSFRGPVWIMLVLIGSIFLIDRIYPYSDFDRYLWPVLIISIGLMMILRPRRKHTEAISPFGGGVSADATSDDMIDSVTIFGGVKKKIISKNFRGGEMTTIFGGTELDLTKAEVPGKIVLELTQIFGGTKLIVPPHWRIQSEDLVSIFGGMDDKRPIHAETNYDESRVLVLKGTCIFGGIDIKSY
jgi:predicted membrane protein